MTLTGFEWAYLVGLVLATIVRKAHVARAGGRASLKGTPGLELGFMIGWGVAAGVLPVLHLFTDLLAFADYPFAAAIHPAAGYCGVALFVAGIWLLHRSHADLGRQWSATIELQAGHQLVTNGVYRRIRHPMYTAHILWAAGQALLVPNFVAGLLALPLLAGMLITRIPREERLMLAEFGYQYREYQARSGRISPWL